tara:strand:+ start:71280 stop:71831 length:552 start_codon:yes stop_codon:yes gene_type:complete
MSEIDERIFKLEVRLENYKKIITYGGIIILGFLGLESFYLIPQKIEDVVGDDTIEQLEQYKQSAQKDAEFLKTLANENSHLSKIQTGTYHCDKNHVVGPEGMDTACSVTIKFKEAFKTDYTVLSSVISYGPSKNNYSPVYQILDEIHEPDGFYLDIKSAYHHLNQITVRWIAIPVTGEYATNK